MLRTVLACFVVFGLVSPSLATTGPGCLVVVNVASNDVFEHTRPRVGVGDDRRQAGT
jgi:hypothetical protein